MNIKVGGIYEHYKNKKRYHVVGIGKHSETLEDMVIYEPLYDDSIAKFWIRPSEMFLEKVKHEGKTVSRFTEVLVGEE